jgi:EmrB/QacA subfamily drug resistance transporter
MMRKSETPSRRQVLIVMCFALGTVVSAVSSLNVALPSVARDTHASQTELQWVIDAYALVFAAFLLPAGAVGDRYGRRRILLGGLVLFGAASAVAMLLRTPGGLIAVRAILGLGAALIMPATLSIITTTFPREQRAGAVSIWAGVAGGSAVLGLLVSGTLLEWFSWQSVFGLNVVLAAVAAAGTFAVVPARQGQSSARLDPIGGLLAAAALGSLIYAVIEGPDLGWTAPATLTGFALAVMLFPAFVLWELRAGQPMLDPRLFRERRFGAGSLSITLQFFAFFGFVFLGLQYLQLVRGDSPLVAALSLVPMALGIIAMSRLSPRLVERAGQAPIAVLGLLAMAAGMGVLSLAGAGSSYWLLLAGLAPLGIGMGLCTAPATDLIVESVGEEKQGVASAVNDAAREVGGALGIAVLGSVLNDQYRSGVSVATRVLPDRLAHSVEKSLGLTLQLTGGGQPHLRSLADTARLAWVDGFGAALAIGALVLAVSAMVIGLLLRGQIREVAPVTSSAGSWK